MSTGASPFVVLAAVFALLIQVLLPSAAMAAQAGANDGVVICTSQGMQTLDIDAGGQPAKKVAGLPCADCLAASIAAVVSEPPVAITPVAYVTGVVLHTVQPRRQTFYARAPPRPPGQAPPIA